MPPHIIASRRNSSSPTLEHRFDRYSTSNFLDNATETPHLLTYIALANGYTGLPNVVEHIVSNALSRIESQVKHVFTIVGVAELHAVQMSCFGNDPLGRRALEVHFPAVAILMGNTHSYMS